MSDIKVQIIAIKQEIEEYVREVRCSYCNKLLAIERDGKIIIRCGRCKQDTAIDRT